MFLWLYAVIALTIGAFLYAMLAAPVPGLRHALEFGPLVGLGRISYGVYLIHFPVILFLARTGRNPFSNRGALIALGATLAIALLSYFLLERPCLRLKARFAAARAPAPATDAPAEPARRAA
jgi:peptidoglycan/LPS O-acetylase OafA/YrhL